MGRLTRSIMRKQLGPRIVVEYGPDGYRVNPEGSGCKELHPDLEQAVLDGIAFPPKGRFPQVVDKRLAESGVAFVFRGF